MLTYFRTVMAFYADSSSTTFIRSNEQLRKHEDCIHLVATDEARKQLSYAVVMRSADLSNESQCSQ